MIHMNFKKQYKVALFALTAILVASSILIATNPVSAQQSIGTQAPTTGGVSGIATQAPQQTFTLTNPLKATSIGQVVLDFTTIFSYVVILIAVLALIFVGFQYIMASAQGNSDKIKDLHSYLLYIVIGIAVVIGARVIVQVVFNTLQATGTINSNVSQGVNQALQK